MRILVTGSSGFIGKNLVLRLHDIGGHEVVPFLRTDTLKDLRDRVRDVDAVVHLAGENRPADPKDFVVGNADFTRDVCGALQAQGRRIPILIASSTQATLTNPYGSSKRAAESYVEEYSTKSGSPAYLYRLPNVFGKWARPNYNSVVATFCHNVAHGLPIRIDDHSAALTLAYVDDVVDDFCSALQSTKPGVDYREVRPSYFSSVGEIARLIVSFREGRDSLFVERVGTGLIRALYSTYVSYLPTSAFAYPVPAYRDDRGGFVEMLKTRDSGQISFFTAHPGVTRGGHYHHSKTEKFMVIQGSARFRFRNVVTNATHELHASGEEPTIVETIPGWAHDISNVGSGTMIVMLWANEVFDRNKADTITSQL